MIEKIKNNEKILLVSLYIIYLTYSILLTYKSAGVFFYETLFSKANLIFYLISALFLIFIKNGKLLFALIFFLILDIPFQLKSQIQNYLINSNLGSLFEVHILTIISLVLISFLILFFLKFLRIKTLGIFLSFFYLINIISLINSPILNSKININVDFKIKKIDKNYYILLFDEYPSEEVQLKYLKIKYTDLPSFFLRKFEFNTNPNIFANFLNTEQSTTSLLVCKSQKESSFLNTVYALSNNIFTNNSNFDFKYYSIFDNNNRPNSLVATEFINNDNSILSRYIIPFIYHYFSNRGIGVFTDYNHYNHDALTFLKKETELKKKNTVVYIHFFSPHNYPLIVYLNDKERIDSANKLMLMAIKIIKKNNPRSGILLISDHGLRANYIPTKLRNKNILYYNNIKIDTVNLNKQGLSYLFKNIKF